MPQRAPTWTLLALLVGLAWPLAMGGQEPKRTPQGPSPLLRGRLDLSLADAIRMGLENNLDVQVERYAPIVADLDVRGFEGVYDPTWFAEFGYEDTQTPTANILTGTPQNVLRTTDGGGGVTGAVPWLNTEYSAEFFGARTTTNSAIQALSPEYFSGWSLTLAQPLLRDLIWSEPWTQVKTSRVLQQSAHSLFRQAVMDVVLGIEQAYWMLVAAEEALRVAEKSLETAKALLEQTDAQFEVGVVSKVEVTEAEAGLAQREVALIQARNDYRNQQDDLIDRVLGPHLRATSTLVIDPADRPDEVVPYEVDLDAAVARAFENRPELTTAAKEIERQEIQLRFARNQKLPQLDGVVSYGQLGLAGRSVRPPIPSQGGFRNTFDDYDDSPQLSARGIFSFPFPNRTARARESVSEVELARARTQQRRLEQQVIIEVRQAARNLLAAQEGIEAARSAQRAAAEQLRAEEIRLEYGESTPFDVLQREEALVESEQQQIDAYQNYRTSITALDRAQGTILRNRNIKIADVAPLR